MTASQGCECVQCGKVIPGQGWSVGQCYITVHFDYFMFACCRECAIKWADANCAEGTVVQECVTIETPWKEVGFREVHVVGIDDYLNPKK